MRRAWVCVAGAALLAPPLLWTQDHQHWFAAQLCLITIVVLLANAARSYWQSDSPVIEFSIAAATNARALQKLLWLTALGAAALFLNATRYRRAFFIATAASLLLR